MRTTTGLDSRKGLCLLRLTFLQRCNVLQAVKLRGYHNSSFLKQGEGRVYTSLLQSKKGQNTTVSKLRTKNQNNQPPPHQPCFLAHLFSATHQKASNTKLTGGRELTVEPHEQPVQFAGCSALVWGSSHKLGRFYSLFSVRKRDT